MRIHITEVVENDILKYDVFNDYGLHIASRDTVLTGREISLLLQHSIEYVEILDRPSILNNSVEAFDQLERTLESTASPKWVPQMKPIYNSVVNEIKELFEIARIENKIDTNQAVASFYPLLDNLQLERDVVSLLLLLNNSDSYTYQHSVQVGMLSYYIANWLGLSNAESTRIGYAGFLHDIGKCKIPNEVLNKPEKLTAEEYEEVKKHTIYGYEIIKNSTSDEMMALGALHHHERYNGGGYPHGLKGEEISLFGRIIAIADIYSAMTSTRIYQKERDMLYVLKEVHRLGYSDLDPVITQAFISHMIPNFIGKRVTLSDGRSGTIIMTHPTDFFNPLVQVESQFIDLSIVRSLEITHVYF